MKNLQVETEKAYKQIEIARRQLENQMKDLKKINEEKIRLMEEREGLVNYHNNQQSRQLEELEKTSS